MHEPLSVLFQRQIGEKYRPLRKRKASGRGSRFIDYTINKTGTDF
ncbi:hypothetical protein [Rhodohalobacter mucosus]|nr:hypothetical protein [Rhodohalobacter mucosus]